MKKLVLVVAVACVGVVAATRVYAGLRSTYPVQVGTGSWGGYAYGSLSDARAAADPNEAIGCSLDYYLTSTGALSSVVYECAAQAQGVYFGCAGNDPTVAQILSSGLHGDSYLFFEGNSMGYCTYVEIHQSSDIAPKGP